MSYSSVSLKTTSGVSITTHVWTPPQEPKALVHIFHGMMEHGQAYSDLAQFLNNKGIIVVSHDHRGHGQTGVNETGLGYFNASWKTVVQDAYDCHLHFKHLYQDIPFILLGHSMGSFIALQTIKPHPTSFKGVVLSGSTYEAPSKMIASTGLAYLFSLLFGGRSKANLIHRIIFGGYNKQFKSTRTQWDWLSRKESFVSQYLADPLCGNVCSIRFYRELFSMLSTLYKKGYLEQVPSQLPLYLFSGTDDPVGYMGRGFNKLVDFLRHEGLTELTAKLYSNGRHVMLQETNKEEVKEDLYHWINCHFL